MIRGRITTCDHKIFELPELLSWDVRYTGSVPCDSYKVTFSYTAELEPVLRRAAGFTLMDGENVLLRGIGVGSGCASGNVCTVNTLSDLESDFKDGDVIVTKMTSSEMLPYMRRASAVVVESTDPECHAAVACQALGIPLILDRTYQAVHMLKSGMMITIDADEGFIYNGIKG